MKKIDYILKHFCELNNIVFNFINTILKSIKYSILYDNNIIIIFVNIKIANKNNKKYKKTIKLDEHYTKIKL